VFARGHACYHVCTGTVQTPLVTIEQNMIGEKRKGQKSHA
jgi:hypothetical protein